MLELVLAAVKLLTGDIVIITNRPEAYAWTGLPLVTDNYPGLGPLAGLEAGLTAATAEYNLLVACDMPWLAPAMLEYLSGLAAGYDAVVPLNREGWAEPLCAVYSKKCLPIVKRNLANGELKMTAWLNSVNVRFVPAEKLAKYDPELGSFRNLNRPEDLPVLYNE